MIAIMLTITISTMTIIPMSMWSLGPQKPETRQGTPASSIPCGGELQSEAARPAVADAGVRLHV